MSAARVCCWAQRRIRATAMLLIASMPMLCAQVLRLSTTARAATVECPANPPGSNITDKINNRSNSIHIAAFSQQSMSAGPKQIHRAAPSYICYEPL